VPDVILADEELRRLLSPALRADMALVETYRYEPEAPFDFSFIAFGGDEDRMVRRPELEQWSAQTSGEFRLRMMSGDHLFLQAKRSELMADVTSTLGLSGGRMATPSAE
jgi:medium-chain acyl-[acyl-carrier-protein] hydrolase